MTKFLTTFLAAALFAGVAVAAVSPRLGPASVAPAATVGGQPLFGPDIFASRPTTLFPARVVVLDDLNPGLAPARAAAGVSETPLFH